MPPPFPPLGVGSAAGGRKVGRGAYLDPTQQLCRGLSLACPIHEGGGGIYDYQARQMFAPVAGTTWGVTPYGYGLTNASDGVTGTTTINQPIAPPYSVTVAFQFVNAFVTAIVWGNDLFSGLWCNTGGQFLILNSGAGATLTFSPAGLTAGTWCVVTVTATTTSIVNGTPSTYPLLYLNGQLVGSPTVGAGTTTVNAPTTLRLGARGGSAQNMLDAPILWVAYHNRVLSAFEAGQLGGSFVAIDQLFATGPIRPWPYWQTVVSGGVVRPLVAYQEFPLFMCEE